MSMGRVSCYALSFFSPCVGGKSVENDHVAYSLGN